MSFIAPIDITVDMKGYLRIGKKALRAINRLVIKAKENSIVFEPSCKNSIIKVSIRPFLVENGVDFSKSRQYKAVKVDNHFLCNLGG